MDNWVLLGGYCIAGLFISLLIIGTIIGQRLNIVHWIGILCGLLTEIVCAFIKHFHQTNWGLIRSIAYLLLYYVLSVNFLRNVLFSPFEIGRLIITFKFHFYDSIFNKYYLSNPLHSRLFFFENVWYYCRLI